MLFFNIYFLFPMRFCTEIRDERIFFGFGTVLASNNRKRNIQVVQDFVPAADADAVFPNVFQKTCGGFYRYARTQAGFGSFG